MAFNPTKKPTVDKSSIVKKTTSSTILNSKTKNKEPSNKQTNCDDKPAEKYKIAACLFLINPKNNQIVATTRRNSTNLGLPGGKSDPNESPMDAAVRETKEETGITIDPKNLQTLFIDIVHIDPKTGLQVEKKSKKELKLFKTFCFFCFFDGDIPGGIEENITAKWISTDDFLQNSAFKIYDSNVVKTFKELPPF